MDKHTVFTLIRELYRIINYKANILVKLTNKLSSIRIIN